MLEHLNIKPEHILETDSVWFQSLFKSCFKKEDPWIQHLGETQYGAFHLNRQAFIFTYTVENFTDLLVIGSHPDQRRKGLASVLLGWFIDQSPKGQKFFLEVECQNIAAINLYKKLGFELVSVRKGYYQQPFSQPLDAYVMAYQK